MAFLELRHPIVLAPMAGGPSTPELAAAVSGAGGLGSHGVAYVGAAQIRADVARIRELTDAPFALNLFVPEARGAEPDRARLEEVQDALARWREEVGLPPRGPVPPAPSFAEQVAAVVEARVAAVSFTFGVPSADVVRAVHDSGALVVGTATHVAEARALVAGGADAIVAQGGEAGGHRGTFLGPADAALIGTMAVVPEIVDAVAVPVIAAGGIMDGRGVAAALALGAAAAQLGTAFLDCAEAGSDEAYRRELRRGAGTATTVTRVFSGKAARGLRNRFIDEWGAREPAPFPLMNALTRDLRAAARKQGRADLVNLWAGQGIARLRPRGPAAALVAALVAEMDAAVSRLRG